MAEPEVAKGNASAEKIDALERARDESEKKAMTVAKGAEIEAEENEKVESVVDEEDSAELECLQIGKSNQKPDREDEEEEEMPRCLMETGMKEFGNPSSMLTSGMEEIPVEIPNWFFEEELDHGVMKPRSETGIGVVQNRGRMSETRIVAVRTGSRWSEMPLTRCEGAELVVKMKESKKATKDKGAS